MNKHERVMKRWDKRNLRIIKRIKKVKITLEDIAFADRAVKRLYEDWRIQVLNTELP